MPLELKLRGMEPGETVELELGGRLEKLNAGGGGVQENVVSNPTEEQSTSPIPGLVKVLKCKDGDVVEKGQVIAVMEAMKMQTAIPAKMAGVLRYKVSEGTTLSKKDVLVAEI